MALICLAPAALTAAGRNLVVNGGFEQGRAGWAGDGVIDSAKPHSGSACLRVDDDDPRGDITAYRTDLIPIEHGQAYTFQVWVRCVLEGQQALVTIDQYDDDGNWISGNNQDFTVHGGKDWKLFSMPIRSFHSEAAGIGIFLRPVQWSETGHETGTAWFDDVKFIVGGVADPIYGSWLATAGPVRVWESPVEQKVLRDRVLPDNATRQDSITITAARGETESVQVVLVPRAGDALTSATFSRFNGPGGDHVEPDQVTIREVAYVEVTQPTDVSSRAGWTPDPLPLLDLPLELGTGKQQPLWIDLRIPDDAVPGKYTGSLQLRFRASPVVTLPLNLQVWDFEMPAERHMRTAYGLWLDLIDRYHNLGGDAARRREVFRMYLEDFAAHRISAYDPVGDDRMRITFPDWNWEDGVIVDDGEVSANRVLEVDDDSTQSAVSAGTEIAVPARAGFNYELSWRARTDGLHDYLVSVNQYDSRDEWISGHNLDFTQNGNGQWQSRKVAVRGLSSRTAYVRLRLYARRWTEEGELTGRTWFDDIVLSEAGSGTNLIVNGDFERTADEAAIEIDFSRFDAAASLALDQDKADSFLLDLPWFGGGALGDFDPGRFLGLEWGTAEFESAYGRMLRVITDHLAARGWLDRAYAYWYDEPEPETYKYVVRGMGMLRRMEPRLTRLLTEQYEEELDGTADIWAPLLDLHERGWAAERQARGEEVWWYVCTGPKAPYPNNFIDHAGIEHRVRFWLAWKLGVQGDLFWQTNFWTTDGVFDAPDYQDPWTDPMSYSLLDGEVGHWGNGDGRLLYPPREWRDGRARIEGPTPSIRWQLIRDGIEDYEYFWMLDDAADRLDQLGSAPNLVARARRLLEIPTKIAKSTTVYTGDPRRLEAHRLAVARTVELAVRKLARHER